MNNTTNGREYVAVSVSMTPEEWGFVDSKVERLRPGVANRSHYFRKLVDADRRLNIVEEPQPPADYRVGVPADLKQVVRQAGEEIKRRARAIRKK